MSDDELDKMAEDLYNDLMGKKPKKPIETREENYADRFEGLIEDIRKAGGNVPDNWQEWVDDIADDFDSMLDGDMEDMDLYDFEFMYMPSLAETDWVDDSSRDVCLGDAIQVLANASDSGIGLGDIDVAEFKVTHKTKDGLDIFVYEFPAMSKSPFAKYGVIIFGPKGGRYYTLEFERPGCYMICNPTTEMHNNFGYAENTSKEGFVKEAISLYKEE